MLKIKELEDNISGFGINCSSFESVLFGLEKLKAIAKVPLVSKPSMGVPGVNQLKTATEFSEFCVSAIKAGAKLIGGCCGTTPEYIKLAKENIDEYYSN